MNRRVWRLAASTAAVYAALAAQQALAQTAGLNIEVLSSMPELVTGGDALVKITGTDAAPTVTVGGTDVSAAFKQADGGWIGLVEGLKDGENELLVKAGANDAALTLINAPINGTLFAGPQQKPFVCENEDHKLQAATDASCAAPSTVNYFYRNPGGEWKPFDPNGARPADIATTTTTEGKEVPLIVRQEKGVINRSAYLINILHDPAAGPLPSPGADSAASGWNGKLIYSFGGGVQANYHMGRSLGGMSGGAQQFIEDLGAGFQDEFVTRGYAVAAGSLNVMGTNNDDVKSAETVAKVKEHFIEQFGAPLFTIGHGASGGSMQQHMIAHNYPGLLDGIMPMRSYPDTMSFLQPLFDCELLVNYFKGAEGYSNEQKDAVAGKHFPYCVRNGARYPNLRPDNCDAAVKDAIANDPALKGTRCTYQDNLANVFGIDPETGFARNPFDNIGVQYGLKALNDGVITFDQFVDLNTKIGGHDADGKIVAQRMEGDEVALERAYLTGRVSTGAAGLAETAIVDLRSWTDGPPPAPHDQTDIDVHDGYHSMSMRARLERDGHAANHVMLTAASIGRTQLDTRTDLSPLSEMSAEALTQLDAWLTAVANDTSDRPLSEKIAANRPAELVDACYPAVAGPLVGIAQKETDMARCNEIFAFAGDARLAAGAPRTDDIFKCQLKPVDAADYNGKLSADQLKRLEEVFPQGVCDYSKPGVGQAKVAGTWIFFEENAEFEPLEAAN